jgi:hypothetical protein
MKNLLNIIVRHLTMRYLIYEYFFFLFAIFLILFWSSSNHSHYENENYSKIFVTIFLIIISFSVLWLYFEAHTKKYSIKKNDINMKKNNQNDTKKEERYKPKYAHNFEILNDYGFENQKTQNNNEIESLNIQIESELNKKKSEIERLTRSLELQKRTETEEIRVQLEKNEKLEKELIEVKFEIERFTKLEENRKKIYDHKQENFENQISQARTETKKLRTENEIIKETVLNLKSKLNEINLKTNSQQELEAELERRDRSELERNKNEKEKYSKLEKELYQARAKEKQVSLELEKIKQNIGKQSKSDKIYPEKESLENEIKQLKLEFDRRNRLETERIKVDNEKYAKLENELNEARAKEKQNILEIERIKAENKESAMKENKTDNNITENLNSTVNVLKDDDTKRFEDMF